MSFKQKLSSYILILIFFLTNFDTVLAQTKKIDSLLRCAASHTKQDDVRAKILFDLTTQTLPHNPKSALKYPEEILSFENKVKDKNIVSATHRIKGVIHVHLAMYPEALTSLNKALSLSIQLKNDLQIGAALSNIGTVYLVQSKFPEALKYLLDALKSFEKNKNEQQAANDLGTIGIVYTEMGDFTEAMKYYQKSLALHQKLKNYVGQSSVLANIGIIQFKTKNISEAINYSQKSLKIADSIADLRATARDNGNLSAYYNELKNHDLALTYGLKAMEINTKTNNKRSLGINMQNVSAAYLGKVNYQEAKSYGLKALQTGNELNITELKRDASLGLSELYDAMKMPDSALIYHKQYTKFADTISNDKKKNEITRMGIQFDFDKKELSYKQKELLTGAQLKQQQLQLALNHVELQKGLQFRDLQTVQLQNEKLQSEEKEKQLIIARNKEKLQASKVSALSQQQKLNKLELKQLWLYWILALVVLMSVLVYLLNLYRIRRLKYKNELQHHQHQLSESELKAIRAQMNPHFIFNVLNSIEAYVMDNEKRKASRLIQKFAALSRLILENSTRSLVSGDKEWKALMLYTELEAMRYDDTFTYSFTVADNIQLKTLYLPPMLIQPLIENAILHGLIIEPKADAHLAVTIQRKEDEIRITVEDNGVGIGKPANKNLMGGVKEMSMGLASIQERIDMINKQQIGKKASFTIEPGANQNGTIAIICFPFFERV
ncbi:tetratricopeptide repeat protein [Pedobacter foliorum]|uniref:tetratricopeptide repeat-containing sensor histidine kinase n=1 Tax=Pedobacter foliorum TaxID=2739058 RepID=UPI0015651A93|nr:tetratricopeptide repeat protein [Pedobacter foliorum]NRF37427.1 tetratricopeptide repeat protein [Pedobacter foliorum]